MSCHGPAIQNTQRYFTEFETHSGLLTKPFWPALADVWQTMADVFQQTPVLHREPVKMWFLCYEVYSAIKTVTAPSTLWLAPTPLSSYCLRDIAEKKLQDWPTNGKEPVSWGSLLCEVCGGGGPKPVAVFPGKTATGRLKNSTHESLGTGDRVGVFLDEKDVTQWEMTRNDHYPLYP
jgi:hypothetical protein